MEVQRVIYSFTTFIHSQIMHVIYFNYYILVFSYFLTMFSTENIVNSDDMAWCYKSDPGALLQVCVCVGGGGV
jgi:hypothetical protein